MSKTLIIIFIPCSVIFVEIYLWPYTSNEHTNYDFQPHFTFMIFFRKWYRSSRTISVKQNQTKALSSFSTQTIREILWLPTQAYSFISWSYPYVGCRQNYIYFYFWKIKEHYKTQVRATYYPWYYYKRCQTDFTYL